MLFQKSHDMHIIFSLVSSTPAPMSSLDTVSKFTLSQRDHTSSMVGYHYHVSTASSQRYLDSQSRNPESEFAWQPGKQVWVSVLISQLPAQWDKTCDRGLYTQKLVILIHVRHHVSIYVWLFFVPCLQQRSETNGEVSDDTLVSTRLDNLWDAFVCFKNEFMANKMINHKYIV